MQSDRRPNPRPQAESSKVFNPQALHELSDSPYPRSLIAFTHEDKPTCINFKTWLQNNKSKLGFPIYMIKSRADPALTGALYRMFNIHGSSFYGIGQEHETIDFPIGFNEKTIVSFFTKNFPSETIELS